MQGGERPPVLPDSFLPPDAVVEQDMAAPLPEVF